MASFLARWAYLSQFPTRHELAAERVVAKLGVPYRLQPMLTPYFPDFLFPEHKVILEIDGASHFTREGLEKDVARDRALSLRGYQVVHVTNQEVDQGPEVWLQRLQDALGAAERVEVAYSPRPVRKRRVAKLTRQPRASGKGKKRAG